MAERHHRHQRGDPDQRTGAHIVQAVLFALGVLVMIAFVRAAQRIEPFTRRF